MKKLFSAMAVTLVCSAFAQTTTTTTTTTTHDGKTHTSSASSEYDGKFTLSAIGSFPTLNQVGLSLEFLGTKETKSMNDKSISFYSSKIVNVTYGMMKYEFDVPLLGERDVDGQGFVIEVGQRTYFSGKSNGLYMGNYLSYGNIKFDENVSYLGSISDNFEGTYQYFSFFSPEVGYKIQAGPVAIDPFVGVMWKLEVKGKGDIDNRNVEEWTPRVGIKVGMVF